MPVKRNRQSRPRRTAARQRKRLEQQLRESEDRLKSIFDLEVDCVKIIAPDGRLREMNAAGLAMLEVDSFEEVRDARISDFVVPPHRNAVEALTRRVMTGERGDLQFEIVGRRGTRRLMETHGAPCRDEAGNITGMLAITRDVTERRKADEDLRRRELQLALIYDTVGESIFQFAVEGPGRFRCTLINKAAVTTTGIPEDMMVGRLLNDVVDGRLFASMRSHFEKAIRERRMVRWDETADFPVGHLEGEMSASPVFNEAGECTHIIGSARDITERNNVERELRKTTERLQSLSRQLLKIREIERRQLATDLHDELGQSLTAAKISLQSLKRFTEPALITSRLDDTISLVESALQRVRSLALELRPPMLDDLGLSAAVAWLVDQLARHSPTHFELRTEVDDRRFDHVVETACFRVAQEALTNVVRHANARNAAVELAARDGGLHLHIIDDGVGFDVNQARLTATRGGTIGVLGMEERASLASGGVEWNSAEGEGTHVHAWFSLTGNTDRDAIGRRSR